ncbi:MAG: cysteine synthase CysM [Gammaproteobacteria bacterium]|nr:cysteine synthase CysM [Gammaproteobacteria bacterium]
MNIRPLAEQVGQTRLVKLQRMVPTDRGNVILCKLEGDNPAGSVKDRPAINMIERALERGTIKAGDTLIEATSGNTGIALAMAAAVHGLKMVLIMPDNLSVERRASMKAYGAELILVTAEEGMEGARDLAMAMQAQGKGLVLDQFSNLDNPDAHIRTTGPEIYQQTEGKVTHFVSSMGTTGTITGVSKYLKSQNADIQIVGVQPADGASIPGIRRWPEEYLPAFYDPANLDLILDVTQAEAEQTTRDMATEEGIFAGISSGGTLAAALRLERELTNAVIVTIVCDRGDRYLSTGVFPA